MAAAAKEEARALVVALLARCTRSGRGGGRSRERDRQPVVRGRREASSPAASGTRIGSLVVPKVERPETSPGWRRCSTRSGSRPRRAIQALVETAGRAVAGGRDRGVLAAPRVPDPRLRRPRGLARAAARPRFARPWLHAQETVLVAARASGLQAIDGPYLAHPRRRTACGSRADQVRALGFDGKWAVHPAQLERSTRRSPRLCRGVRARAARSWRTRSRARRRATARGAVELDGEMIDEASRKLALHIVARGRAAGLA